MIIIAGIAMILMPSLIASNEKQIFVTSLQKTYTQFQDINQATAMLIARGTISSTTTNANKTFIQTVYATQKTIDFVGKDTDYLKNYKPQLINKATTYADGNPGIAVLKNGVIIMDDGTNIVVDINGLKGPNLVGKDIYYFQIKQNDGSTTLEPLPINVLNGSKVDTFPTNCKKNNFDTPSNHQGCADYILNYKHRIDYY